MFKIRLISIIVLVAALLGQTGCTSGVFHGYFLTGTSQNLHNSPGSTIGPGRIQKKGESCSYGSWLFGIAQLFYFGGGNSIQLAAANGGITRIGVVDRSSLTVLAIFYRDCVIVWGE
jgi:TRL-like protein family